MRIDTGRLYRDTVTVLNKLDAKDAALRQDAWYKHVLRDCMWSSKTLRSVGGDGTVQIGTAFRVQIPEGMGYMPYKEWSAPENRDAHFTIRPGDYVIRGEVAEDVTPETLRKVVAKYEPEACQVKGFDDRTDATGGIGGGRGGLMRFAEVLSIEGA